MAAHAVAVLVVGHAVSRATTALRLTLARDTSLAALPALALVHAQSRPFARAAAYPS
jgi:hypothetical protein